MEHRNSESSLKYMFRCKCGFLCFLFEWFMAFSLELFMTFDTPRVEAGRVKVDVSLKILQYIDYWWSL